ncbi:uncharacterized protein METZ01_LOCUS77212 [marine metagenome]|uniref:Uncharacterized protein n=1 Tax=marine metagenome TaxID=408172 RepID=A0A381U9W7_9ZZZZ
MTRLKQQVTISYSPDLRVANILEQEDQLIYYQSVVRKVTDVSRFYVDIIIV